MNNIANAALLKKLGARAWDNSEVECILLVGAYLEKKPLKSTKVVTMSNHDNGVETDVHLPLAGPLRSEGSVITDKGLLAFLKTNFPVNQDSTPHALLANMGGLKGFSDITSIRKQLVENVPELSGLLSDTAGRLVKTDLEPEIIDVAPDCREVAFAKYCEGLGL